MTKIKEDALSKTIEVIENAVITFEDGYIALYDAIYVADKEVVFGKLSDKNGVVFVKVVE